MHLAIEHCIIVQRAGNDDRALDGEHGVLGKRCGHGIGSPFALQRQLATTYGDARCQSISARPVDKLVTTLILEALSHAAIDVSLQAAEDIDLERQQLHEPWKLRLERAGYATALVPRRYDAVEPDNRLR